MGLLLLRVEATCLNPQHRKQTVKSLIHLNCAAPYRSESGLVLCCIPDMIKVPPDVCFSQNATSLAILGMHER
jgi:hypothetical protein